MRQWRIPLSDNFVLKSAASDEIKKISTFWVGFRFVLLFLNASLNEFF